jgi:hypothetical protein
MQISFLSKFFGVLVSLKVKTTHLVALFSEVNLKTRKKGKRKKVQK